MARDEALLESAESGTPGFRVYGWDGPWVSLGMNQDAARDLLPGAPVRSVVRPTGGKAVLHGHDVTVGVAMPLGPITEATGIEPERLARSVRTVYRWLAVPFLEALGACRLPASLAEQSQFYRRGITKISRSADCFGQVCANDIVDARTGQKVCGCALRLTRRAVLLQASIPAGPPLVEPRLVFVSPRLSTPPTWDTSAFAKRFEEAFQRAIESAARLAAN